MNKALLFVLLASIATLSLGFNLVTTPNDDRVKVD
jgi:hypothetical protein